ncbi:MAG: hypothetical protein RBU37_14655 [Myxococcota bacterium]|jgi:hypothetical protein|nr:hypothetical protein [Myxococcota bacterium]
MPRNTVQRLRPQWTLVEDTASLDWTSTGSTRSIIDVCEHEQALVLLRHGLLSIVRDGETRHLSLPSMVSGATLLCRYGSAIALGTPQGLFSFELGSERFEQLDEQPVTFLDTDYADRLWLGGHRLSCLFEGGRLDLPREFSQDAFVRALSLGNDGCVYAVVEDEGVWRYTIDNEQWSRIEALPSTACRALVQLSDGTLAVLFDATGRAVGQPGLSYYLPNGRVEDVHLLEGGTQLMGTFDKRMLALCGDRIWGLKQRQWTPEATPNERGGRGVYRLRRGRGAKLWFSSPTGLSCYSPFASEHAQAFAQEAERWQRLPMHLAEQDLVVAVALGVGWVDNRFDRKERSELFRHIENLGHRLDAPVARFLLLCAAARPSQSFETFLRIQLRAVLTELDLERAQALQAVTLDIATAIADASGGFLGLGSRISQVERAYLQQLQSELSLG